MNVFLFHSLIGSAVPPRAVFRQSQLAAAGFVLGFCGAASAQGEPVAPPLTLWNAVELAYSTEEGKTYVIEKSDDLRLWTAGSSEEFGDQRRSTQIIPVSGASPGTGYFRLKIRTLPAEGRARWAMDGCSMLFTTPSGPCLMVLGENGAGTLTDEHRKGTFTWDWQRTGSDTGCLTVTWPDGVVECMDMNYRGQGAGAYTSRRTLNGMPAGAAMGTFRLSADASVAPAAPLTLGDALIVFSGSGRPVSVNLKAEGTAAISSPAGPQSFGSSYQVTGGTTASLTLECKSGLSESWQLEFTGPGCGTYTSATRLNGRLRRSGSGTFTIKLQ